MAKNKADEIMSWERQPNESVQAYEAFYLYLKMGNKRSLRKVEQELDKSHTLIGRWSSQWEWQRRSRDYDNELRRKEFEETQEAAKKMRKRQIQTAMLMQQKAIQALNDLEIENLTPKVIVSLIKEGAALEQAMRTSQEAALEVKNDNETADDNKESVDLSSFTEEELRKLIEMGGG